MRGGLLAACQLGRRIVNLVEAKQYPAWLRDLAIALIVILCMGAGVILRSLSDNIRSGARSPSRMEFLADPETGCEYLGYKNGGIIPRLDVDGRHKGCREGAGRERFRPNPDGEGLPQEFL